MNKAGEGPAAMLRLAGAVSLLLLSSVCLVLVLLSSVVSAQEYPQNQNHQWHLQPRSDSSAKLHGSMHDTTYSKDGNLTNADREVFNVLEKNARARQRRADHGKAQRSVKRMERALDAVQGRKLRAMSRARNSGLHSEEVHEKRRLRARQLALELGPVEVDENESEGDESLDDGFEGRAAKAVAPGRAATLKRRTTRKKLTTKKAAKAKSTTKQLQRIVLQTTKRTSTGRSSTAPKPTTPKPKTSTPTTKTATKALPKFTETATANPIPLSRATMSPMKALDAPSNFAIAKSLPLDPSLPAAPSPLQVLLVSDTAFSLSWGTVATDSEIRSFGSRYWNSGTRISGYAVDCFTVASLSTLVPDGVSRKSTLTTPYRAIQIEFTTQEALNKLWACTVRVVSDSGVGPIPATMKIGVSLTTGEQRIASLKASASVFYDFNAPLTTLPATQWETHYSICANPASTAAYIPSSFMLLTASTRESPLCPAGTTHSITVKPLMTVDFSGGREATIGFETDGVPEWSSVFSVYLIPDPSADRAYPVFGSSAPLTRRYSSYSSDKDNNLQLRQTASSWLTLQSKGSQIALVNDLEDRDLGFGVPGMRRNVVIKVSKGKFQVSVSGTVVMDTTVSGMDWEKGQLVFELSGNWTDSATPTPLHRVTLDNLYVTYSTPPSSAQPVVLDFPVASFSFHKTAVPGQQMAFQVDVNSSVAGVQTAVLHFTAYDFPNQNSIWEWTNSICILAPGQLTGTTINIFGVTGQRSIACSASGAAGSPELSQDSLKSTYGVPDPWSTYMVVRLETSWIKQGTNVFLFDMIGPIVIGDVHLELTFAAPGPTYSPAAHWLVPYLSASNPEPTSAWIGTGPGSRVTVLNQVGIWDNYATYFSTNTNGLKINSTLLRLEFEAGSWFSGMLSGANFALVSGGITRIEILINDAVVRKLTWPSPGLPYVYAYATIDLTSIADWSTGGARQLRVDIRAYDNKGNPGFPVYGSIDDYGRIVGTWRNKTQPLIASANLGAPTVVKGINMFPPAGGADLPAPTNLSIIEDDRYATFSWDSSMGDYTCYGCRYWSSGIAGYQITWYPLSNPNSTTKMVTPYRATQLQPLTPGVRYGAYVQAIDGGEVGRLGPPSPEIQFQSNSARVDALRAVCNGFFDDFNIGAGAFDAKKWVTSYSICADPAASANFVNAQFHSHNTVKISGRCPSTNLSDTYPAMVTSRPIGVFDFTGTTGTLALDFDGPVSTNYWFLDIHPGIDDDRFSFSGFALQPVPPPTPVPEGLLRLHIAGNSMSLDLWDGKVDRTLVKQLDFATKGITLTPNLRRPFLMKVSKNSFTLDISGVRVVDIPSGLGLPFEKASVHFQQFANVTNANSVPVATVHWDNFGFSSVSGPQKVIRSYRATNSADYKLAGPTLDLSTYSFTISIPDDISQATGGRLKCSRQGDALSNNMFWDGSGIFCFNSLAWTIYGTPTICKIMMPGWRPADPTIGTIESSDPQSVILQLNKSSIRAENKIVVSLPANMYLGDIHLEVDYPAGYAGAYTPPTPWFGNLTAPAFHPAAAVAVGPHARINNIGGATLWESPGFLKAMTTPGGIPVNTTMVSVEGEVTTDVGLMSFGKAIGIVRVELQLDKQVVQTWTFPLPGVHYHYFSTNVDLTGVAPGTHELFLKAYDSAGMASIPEYDFPTGLFSRPIYVGAYLPARITVT